MALRANKKQEHVTTRVLGDLRDKVINGIIVGKGAGLGRRGSPSQNELSIDHNPCQGCRRQRARHSSNLETGKDSQSKQGKRRIG